MQEFEHTIEIQDGLNRGCVPIQHTLFPEPLPNRSHVTLDHFPEDQPPYPTDDSRTLAEDSEASPTVNIIPPSRRFQSLFLGTRTASRASRRMSSPGFQSDATSIQNVAAERLSVQLFSRSQSGYVPLLPSILLPAASFAGKASPAFEARSHAGDLRPHSPARCKQSCFAPVKQSDPQLWKQRLLTTAQALLCQKMAERQLSGCSNAASQAASDYKENVDAFATHSGGMMSQRVLSNIMAGASYQHLAPSGTFHWRCPSRPQSAHGLLIVHAKDCSGLQ